jgi:hypothetical protein
MHIENGKRVVAKSDSKTFKKGDAGILVRQGGIDSENYYFIDLDDGRSIGPSVEDYWEEEPS